MKYIFVLVLIAALGNKLVKRLFYMNEITPIDIIVGENFYEGSGIPIEDLKEFREYINIIYKQKESIRDRVESEEIFYLINERESCLEIIDNIFYLYTSNPREIRSMKYISDGPLAKLSSLSTLDSSSEADSERLLLKEARLHIKEINNEINLKFPSYKLKSTSDYNVGGESE